MSINVDILDGAACAGAAAEVAETIAAYIGEEVAKAARLGIPVALPAREG